MKPKPSPAVNRLDEAGLFGYLAGDDIRS